MLNVNEFDAKFQLQQKCKQAATHSAYNKERRRIRRSLGLCMDCTKRVVVRRRFCKFHLKKARAKWYKYRDEHLTDGLCIRCGSPKDEKATKWFCRPCADFRAEKYRIKRRAKC